MADEYDELLQAAPAINEYDALLKEQNANENTSLRKTVMRAAQTTPDRAAKVIQLSERMKLPADVVERNFDALSRRDAVESNPYDAMIRQSPKLVQWLKEGENAAIARDDLASMGNIEWLMNAPAMALRSGWAQTQYHDLVFESMERNLSPDEQKRLLDLRSQMRLGGDYGAETWFGKSTVGLAGQIPVWLGGLKAGAEMGLPMAGVYGSAAALAGQAGPQILTPEEVITVPGMAARGYYLGSALGAAIFMYRQEAGAAYDEYLQFKDELGRPLDPAMAKAAAVAAGGINAMLEVFQLNTLMRTIPGADKLYGKATHDAIKQALRSPSVRTALKDMMVGYGKTLTTETATEVAQRAVTIMSGELAKFGTDIESRGGAEIAADLVSEGVSAAQAFTFMVAPGHVFRAGQDAVRIREAKKNEAFFQALGEGVAGSKVFERLPGKMQEFVAQATKDGPIENVFVPVDTFAQYWQSQGLDPAAVAAELTGDRATYESAVAEGADIMIPMSRYATMIAPTEHGAFFAAEIRLAPDAMNAREAKEIEAQLKVEKEQAKQAQKIDELTQQIDVIRQDVVQKLIASGVEQKTAEAYAEAHAAVFKAVGTRAGLSPQQAFEGYGLQIEREGMAREGETVMHQELPDVLDVGGVARATKNAAGKQLYPTAEGVTNFWNWFGESKVVDAQSRPLMVYYGGPRDETEISDTERSEFPFGHAFFTDDREVAAKYAGSHPDERSGRTDFSTGRKGRTYKVYLSLQNPWDLSTFYASEWLNAINKTGEFEGMAERIKLVEEDDGYRYWILPNGHETLHNPFSGEHFERTVEALFGARFGGGDFLQNALDHSPSGMASVVFPKAAILIVNKNKYDGAFFNDSEMGGTTYVAFRPEQIKSATSNRGTFDPASGNILYQLNAERDLIIQHNVTADNILHAAKMGGVPVPSLAIMKASDPNMDYGEITMIGAAEMADPRGYARTRVFGADVYSPRYPQISYFLNDKKLRAMRDELQPAETASGTQVDWDEVHTRGPAHLENEPAIMWMFLKARGIEPQIVMEEGASPEHVADLRAAGFEPYFPTGDEAFRDQIATLSNDPHFQRLVADYYRAALDDERYQFEAMNDVQRHNTAYRFTADLARVGLAQKVDAYRTRDALRNQIRPTMRGQFQEFITLQFAKLEATEKLFRGFTYAGNRSYARHTLDNVVRMLKKNIRGGESKSNIYGMGQLRAKFTPQFKSVAGIKKAKGRLISEREMESVKDEVNKEFFMLVKAVSPYYQHGEVKPETLIAVIEDSAKKGLDRSAKDYSFDPLPSHTKQQIFSFMEKLRTLPTEYFEAKIMRAVSLSEFRAAVVPVDVDERVTNILLDAGLTVETYNVGVEGDRKRVVMELADKFGDKVLFQESPMFVSALVQQIANGKLDRAPADQWKAFINGLTSKGVKKEEIFASGVMDWLDIQKALEGKELWHLVDRHGVLQAQGDVLAMKRWQEEGLATGDKIVRADTRPTRDDVLAYLEENHVHIETRILGEAPGSTEIVPADEALGENEDIEEISDEAVSERARQLWEEQLPEEARSFVSESDYIKYVVTPVLPTARIVELPPDVLRGDTMYGVELLEWPQESELQNNTREELEAMLSGESDEFTVRKSNFLGPQFTTEGEARNFAVTGGYELNGPYWSAFFAKSGDYIDGEFDDFYDAENAAKLDQEVRLESEVEAYIEQASVDDNGDYWYNEARQELESEVEQETGVSRIDHERRHAGVTPVRHPRSWQSNGGTNYVEIPIGIGGIEPFGATDTTHFGDIFEGRTVAWLRMKRHADAKGVQTLWIEEIQSKRAESGREEGFTKEPTQEQIHELDMLRNELIDARNKFRALMSSLTEVTPSAKAQADDEVGEVEDRYNAAVRKYQGGGIPTAPFIENTQSWVALALKVALRYAATKSITQVAWTTGDEQVGRYGNWLREQVDQIAWVKTDAGEIAINARQRGTSKVERVFSQNELMSALGLEMATTIINSKEISGTLSGEAVTIDDLGMLNFYGDEQGVNPNGKPAIVTIVADRIAKQLGGKGVKLIDIQVEEGSETYNGAPGFAVTPEMVIKILAGQSLFQETGEPRGSIRFGANRQFRIDLLQKADLSTFLHESGHFWLEVLGDVVDGLSRADPALLSFQQVQMIADYQKVLDWFGVKDRASIGVKQHEQFARAIESYLMDGKAPSIELRSIFAKFRAWLLSVYKSLTQLDVKLTPEVRGVLDRMFATDEEIQAASQEAQVAQMFLTAQEAGMTDAEFAAYAKQVTRVSERAQEELQAKLMRGIKREREAWWKSERERVYAEVEKDVQARREYVMLSVLQKATMPDGSEPAIGAVKLARNALPENAHKTLPRGVTVAGADGVTPQTAAELFGYGSGAELLKALGEIRPMRQQIEIETDARMKAAYPDPMVDGSMIESARAALQNEERATVIQAEMRALSRLKRQAAPAVALERAQGGAALEAERQDRAYELRWLEAERKLAVAIQKGEDQAVIDGLQAELTELGRNQRTGMAMLRSSASIPPLGMIRAIARGRVSQMRVRDLRPTTFLVAARRASKAATEAAGRQEFDVALSAKQRELMNVELYRAAVDAQEEVESTIDYMHGFEQKPKRARIAKAGESYLDQIDGFLDRYEFARVPLVVLERRKNLLQWIEEQERLGITVNLPADVVVEKRTNYKDMSVEELRGVRDSVKHIEHLAKMKNRLLKARAQKALDIAVTEITDSITLNFKGTAKTGTDYRLPVDEALRLVDGWFASHRKLSSQVREMDGFKDGGVLWEYLVRPINEAADTETTMKAKAAQELHRIFSAAYPGREMATLYEKSLVEAIGESMPKMGRLMVALNWGNAGNRQRIISGKGWNEQQVQAILDTLDERDWKFVQDIWDLIDNYWSEIEAKEKRVDGIAPEKVEPLEIVTRFGVMRGGYFPIKYDPRQSIRVGSNIDAEFADLSKKAAYARPTTRRGHTEARLEVVNEPVRLDFGVIFEHINQVIHDLSHHEMLIDAGRLLGNKRVQQIIKDTYGDITYRKMQAVLIDIAYGETGAVSEFERAIDWVRQGVTISALGWNFMTSLLQPFGIAQSIVRVGPQWIGRGFARWMRDAVSFENTAAWIREKSPMMENRGKTQMREINEIRNQLGVHSGKLSGWIDAALRATTFDTLTKQGVADSFFWVIYKGQQIADIPTWLGAYEKAMADEANDEARAVALADQAVLDSQGGGQIKDLAGVQRGGPLLKLWTNFYGYFNVTWNLSAESVKRTNFSDPISIGRLAVDLLLLYAVPATLGVLMKEALVGDDDDDEKLMRKIIQANLSYMAGTMIGLRELGSVLQGYAGYEGPAGTRFFSSMSRLVKQAQQGETDAAFWRALNDAAGIILHYPAGQVNRTAAGYVALQEGRTSNPMALIVGAPK